MTVMGSQSLDHSNLTEDEESLLKRIVEKGVKQLQPSIGLKGVIYDELAEYVEESTVDWPTVRILLESLSKKGFLIVDEKYFALFCPTCDSAEIISILCSSFNSSIFCSNVFIFTYVNDRNL